MQLTSNDLEYLSQCAIAAATDAGRLIAARTGAAVGVRKKSGGESLASQVVTEVDLLSEAAILKHLLPTCERYDLALLSEESADDGARLVKGAFWCIDPMDGTLSFIESIPGYSVSIALVSREGYPLIGVVYDPVTAALYSAIKGRGLMRNGEVWQLTAESKRSDSVLTLVCDRSLVERPDFRQLLASVESSARDLGFSAVKTRHNGGAVMNAIGVLENRPACYFKRPKPGDGGGSLWDFAATACLFQEAGAWVSDYHGKPLDLNRAESTFMNHRGALYATDPAIAAQISTEKFSLE